MDTFTEQPDLVATVQQLDGRGMASGPPRTMPLTHFHAARLPEVGDVVMSVSRYVDPERLSPARLEVRVFRADTADRGSVPTLPGAGLLAHDGGLAFAGVDLTTGAVDFPYERPARRVGRLEAFWLAGSDAGVRAAHVADGLADWVRTILEAELLLAGYLGIVGDARTFIPIGEDADGGEPQRKASAKDKARASRKGAGAKDRPAPTGPDPTVEFGGWVRRWLESHQYAVLDDATGDFVKVLNPPLFSRITGAAGGD